MIDQQWPPTQDDHADDDANADTAKIVEFLVNVNI